MTPEEVEAMLVQELVAALKARMTGGPASAEEVEERWRKGANNANVTDRGVQADLIAQAYRVLKGKS